MAANPEMFTEQNRLNRNFWIDLGVSGGSLLTGFGHEAYRLWANLPRSADSETIMSAVIVAAFAGLVTALYRSVQLEEYGSGEIEQDSMRPPTLSNGPESV